MINKLYVKGKRFFKKNSKIIILTFITALAIFPLPYYIDMPGGAIPVNDRFEIENSFESKGAFHLAYVTERRATPLTFLYAKVQKDWQIFKKSDITYDNETIKEMNFRDHLLLKESYASAITVAYAKANKKVSVQKEKIYVTYIDKKAKTNLQVGDEIIEVDGEKVVSKEKLLSLIQNKKEGQKISIVVQKESKKHQKEATLIKENETPKIGVMINVEKIMETDPDIKIQTKKRESGPSGGLMLALSIYDALVEEDITRGKKIVGTGTIDEKGNVGDIGGVSFKLKGAVKEKADIFIVPRGDNYQEAMQLKKERNYAVKIIPVSTFEEALSYVKGEG